MTVTITWKTLLWIALIIAVLVVAYLVWRHLTAQQAAAESNERLPPSPAPERQIPTRTAAPPPAMAGDAPPGSPGAASPSPPRSSSAAPPPAWAGGTQAPAQSGSSTPPSPRRGTPPPAAAGGVTPSSAPTSTTTMPRTAAPPPWIASPEMPADPKPAPKPASAPLKPAVAGEAASRLAAIESWGYQLQKLDMKRAVASPFDLLVIDYSKDGSDAKALKPADLAKLKRKSDGKERLVLAYLSIGEAESYRYYWNQSWKKQRPEWLLGENPEWKENYSVCYWEPGWQSILCGSPDAYLDKIVEAGFDGVYLDKCDVFEDIQSREKSAAKSRPDLEADMVAFVAQLSDYAKRKKPGFLVVMQNAETLLAHAELRAAIDGVAKEELVFGVHAPEKRNSKAEFNDARTALDLARTDGKTVMVVEYLEDPAKVAEAATAAAKLGYVLYIAPKDRELDRLNYDVLEA